MGFNRDFFLNSEKDTVRKCSLFLCFLFTFDEKEIDLKNILFDFEATIKRHSFLFIELRGAVVFFIESV